MDGAGWLEGGGRVPTGGKPVVSWRRDLGHGFGYVRAGIRSRVGVGLSSEAAGGVSLAIRVSALFRKV